MNSTTGTKPSETITSSNGHLLANSVGEDSMASRTASIEAIEASTFEEQQLRLVFSKFMLLSYSKNLLIILECLQSIEN